MSGSRVMLLVVALAACGGDDGTGVGPQTNTCTGTCLIVSNQSATLAVTEVFYTGCGDPGWGADRLPGSEVLRPGASRGWPVAAGCWDFQARRVETGQTWTSTTFGITLAAGDSHTLVFDF